MEQVLALRSGVFSQKEVTEINRNFRIKTTYVDYAKKRHTRLVGISGLMEMVGYVCAYSLCAKALRSKSQTPRMRVAWTSIQVQFYRK